MLAVGLLQVVANLALRIATNIGDVRLERVKLTQQRVIVGRLGDQAVEEFVTPHVNCEIGTP